MFEEKKQPIKKWLLALPAAAGWLLHAPLYYPLKWTAIPLIKESGHYDSVIISSLFLSYPLYLVLLMVLTAWFTGGCWYLLIPVVLPFFGWSLVQAKNVFQ